MAETVILPRRLLLAAAFCLLPLGARAQALQDPTRPPALAADPEGATVATGPQLQSVLIARRPGGRHVAVIDGEPLRLGEEFRGARVVRISPGEVELARGKERQVLRLAPGDDDNSAITRSARLK